MKFSVVIPSYNQLDYLECAVRSVMDQARSGIEVEIIVQDGGSENWENFEKKQKAEMLRAENQVPGTKNYELQLYSEADNGMYDAINRALDRATGDWCCWLNCDEQLLPGSLAQVAAFAAAHLEAEVLFGDAVLMNEEDRILSYRATVVPTADHVRYVHLNTLSCATFFRRDAFLAGHRLGAEWKTIGDATWMEGMLQAGLRMERMGFATSAFYFTGKNLGSSHLAVREMRQWASSEGPLPRWRILRARLHHWLRKAWAGAYIPRRVEVAVFTKNNPYARTVISQDRVSHRWPDSVFAKLDRKTEA